MVEQQSFDYDPQRHAMPPPNVQPLRADGLVPPRPRIPVPEPVSEDVAPHYVAVAKAVSQIVATRILLLIGVITASIIWCYTAYEPLQLRIVAASAFSVLGVAPLIWLYTKKG